MTSQPLGYATPPPPGSVEVLWRGNDFEVTLPPRADRRLRRAAIAGAIHVIVFWSTAVVAAGAARGFAVDVPVARLVAWAVTTMGVAMAAAFALMGALLVLRMLSAVRQARMWTRISLRDGMLTLEVPALVGVRMIRHRLALFDDAQVRRSRRKNDDRQFLVLRRPDGRYETVLNDLVYRPGDLAAVAASIRAAIVKNSGGL